MKSFDIPEFYRSPIIGKIKEKRKERDPRKKDFSPTVIDFGAIRFHIARHFGFCYGVENAIEISYRAIDENPGKNIFLLSQMIHNPDVNADLEKNGLRFIQDTKGNMLMSWDDIQKGDIVIIPAFGTTIEIENLLVEKGIDIEKYDTTCPFVTRVWKQAQKLSSKEYAVVIHGKADHEETRATFSHSSSETPSVVIRDMSEAKILAQFIRNERPEREFFEIFKNRHSKDFDPSVHLQKLGVINQTTMLATETQAISDFLKNVITEVYGSENYREHFADTRDTLCYATNDNQDSTLALMEQPADLAIVVGGYNSSNTSHLVELLEQKFPTYYIKNESEIQDENHVQHFDFHNGKLLQSDTFLPNKEVIDIAITSGASCPDAVVDRVMTKILELKGVDWREILEEKVELALAE